MMRLTPHTYRRLAFLASWKVMSEINDSSDAIVKIKNAIEQKTSVCEYEKNILEKLDKIYRKLDQLFFDHSDRYIEKKRSRRESLLPDISRFFAELPEAANVFEITAYIFTTPYEIALFYKRFQPVHQISAIINALKQPNVPSSFRTEILCSLINYCAAPTRSFSPGFLYYLGEFFSLLPKIDLSHVAFRFDETDEEKAIFRDAYMEFYHELNKFDQPLAPTVAELKRRNRIRRSHNKKNRTRQKKIKKLIEGINKLANDEKNGMSKKDACIYYFKSNKKYLKNLRITSYRTLQNLCSRAGRSKKKLSIRDQQNAIDVYVAIDEPQLLKKLEIKS